MRVPLFGLKGAFEADGGRYDGVMAPFDFRKDAELAAILNYVLAAWGNDRLLRKEEPPITPEEIATARRADLTPQAVHDSRPHMGGS